MSLSTEQQQAADVLRAGVAAYRDSAALADRLATGVHDAPMLKGLPREVKDACAGVMRSFADANRAKAANLESMIGAAEHGVQ